MGFERPRRNIPKAKDEFISCPLATPADIPPPLSLVTRVTSLPMSSTLDLIVQVGNDMWVVSDLYITKY